MRWRYLVFRILVGRNRNVELLRMVVITRIREIRKVILGFGPIAVGHINLIVMRTLRMESALSSMMEFVLGHRTRRRNRRENRRILWTKGTLYMRTLPYHTRSSRSREERTSMKRLVSGEPWLLLVRMLGRPMRLQNPLFGQRESTSRLSLCRCRYRHRHMRRSLRMICRQSSSPSACMMRMCARITITQDLTRSHRLEHIDHIRVEVRMQVMRLSMRICW